MESRVSNHLTGPYPSHAVEARLREELQNERLKNRQMKLEVAGNDDFNSRLYQNADSLGPNAAFSETVRARVRDRGRYEHLNGNYARGLVRRHAYDLVGACPRPQLTIPGDETGEIADKIERGFMSWAKEIGLGHTYRLMEKCRGHSGEAFAFADNNPVLRHPVKLNIRQFEPEQCVTPWDSKLAEGVIDGIRFDQYGNRVEYFVLKYHPGESNGLGLKQGAGDFLRIPARQVFHWYEIDRPSQCRGIPRIAAALPVLSQVRRWNLATLTAAEFAAMIAGIIKSKLPPDQASATKVADFDFYEIVKGALMTLPADCDAVQMEAKHPNATHGEFKREQLSEAGRGSGAPLNVTTGNSTSYNFSSAKCDLGPYQAEKRIERFDFQSVVMDPIFFMYIEEARIIGLIDESVPAIEEWSIAYNFDGFGSIDEMKDANTDDSRLRNGSTNLGEVEAEYGRDWREQLKQLSREVKAYEAEGLVHPFIAAQKAAPAQQPEPSTDPNDPSADDAESRLHSALTENGVSERVAEQVVSEFFSLFRARNKPSRNGHTHPIGGRL